MLAEPALPASSGMALGESSLIQHHQRLSRIRLVVDTGQRLSAAVSSPVSYNINLERRPRYVIGLGSTSDRDRDHLR
jgi:hypothetical protein